MGKESPQQDLTTTELDRAYWFATHKPLFRKIGLGTLGAIAAISVLFFLYQLVNWLTHIGQTNAILESLSRPQIDYSAIDRPQDIVILPAQAVTRDASSIDVVFGFQNPNTTWAAVELTYEVFVGSQTAGQETVSLAPGQESMYTKMSIPASGGVVPPVSVTIISTEWNRIKRVDLLPEVQWDFSEANFDYISAADEAAFQSELELTVRNKSVYGFRGPKVVVVMKDESGEVQGIGSLQIDRITSLEARTITFRWPARLPRGVQPTVSVTVDLLDEDAIIRE